MADALEELLQRAEQDNAPTALSEVVAAEAKSGPSSPTDAVSQTVTEADIARGQIRFPRAAKELLPTKRCDVLVSLRRVAIQARWDPRLGPDRERSGVLRVGHDHLRRLVTANSRLTVKPMIHLD
jgi:hypothetical protein